MIKKVALFLFLSTMQLYSMQKIFKSKSEPTTEKITNIQPNNSLPKIQAVNPEPGLLKEQKTAYSVRCSLCEKEFQSKAETEKHISTTKDCKRALVECSLKPLTRAALENSKKN